MSRDEHLRIEKFSQNITLKLLPYKSVEQVVRSFWNSKTTKSFKIDKLLYDNREEKYQSQINKILQNLKQENLCGSKWNRDRFLAAINYLCCENG